MLVLNKYLRELGIDENFWIFKEQRQGKEDYLPQSGFIPAEFYDLSNTLAIEIYSYLCYFRDNCTYAIPAELTKEQWEDILNIMIEAFKLKIEKEEWDPTKSHEENKQLSKRRRRKIRRGLKLFIDYFDALWY